MMVLRLSEHTESLSQVHDMFNMFRYSVDFRMHHVPDLRHLKIPKPLHPFQYRKKAKLLENWSGNSIHRFNRHFKRSRVLQI